MAAIKGRFDQLPAGIQEYLKELYARRGEKIPKFVHVDMERVEAIRKKRMEYSPILDSTGAPIPRTITKE